MELIGTIITGVLTLTGVIISNMMSHNKIQDELKQEFKVSQAVTNTKIDSLTQEVKKHNDFAVRIPVVEAELKSIKERLDKLEREVYKT